MQQPCHLPLVVPTSLAFPSLAPQALRTLLELSPSDADRLQLLGEAAGLLSAAPPGAYPAQVGGEAVWLSGEPCRRAALTSALRLPPACPQELRWLVTTAWNRGATHARFGRGTEAGQYQAWAAGALRYDAQLAEQYQVWA